MKFQQARLDNGLQIIAEEKPSSRSVALGFFVRTGARDETPDVAGVSHFLEHMLFKGTPKRSAFDVNREFDEMGAKYNAFTSEETTVYYAAVLPEYLPRVLDLWADLLRPALREDDFETEKGVILEEIAMYEDQPHFDVIDRCRRLHFDTHACGNSVLGTADSIRALSAPQMRDYFNQRYAPDNIVLAAAGNLDFDALVRQAGELCGHWQPHQPRRELSHFPGTGNQDLAHKETVREHFCLMSPAPAAQDPLRHPARVLAHIVGDVTGSRLYWALVDTALVDAADMDYDAMDGTGLFYTYISCDPARAAEVIETTRATFRDLADNPITPAELQAAKNKLASVVTLAGELPMGRLVPLGYGWLYRHEYRPLADDIAAVEAVSGEDLHNLMQQYPLDRFSLQGLGACTSL